MARCPCTFCLTGKPKLCVWRDHAHIVITYSDTPPPEPRWKSALDWALCILFAAVLVGAQLMVGR